MLYLIHISRGLSEEEARAMIVSGFADDVSKELPLEYAVEMNNLIRLETVSYTHLDVYKRQQPQGGNIRRLGVLIDLLGT